MHTIEEHMIRIVLKFKSAKYFHILNAKHQICSKSGGIFNQTTQDISGYRRYNVEEGSGHLISQANFEVSMKISKITKFGKNTFCVSTHGHQHVFNGISNLVQFSCPY